MLSYRLTVMTILLSYVAFKKKKMWHESSAQNADTHMYVYLQSLGHGCGDAVDEKVVGLEITYVCLKCQREWQLW